LGGRAGAAAVDVTDAAAVRRLVEGTVARRGRLDLLFNNAGIGGGGPVEDLDVAAWRRVVDVDLLGVVHGVAAAYPIMVRQGSGHIVNTASLAGLMPAPLLTPYAAAKHAVVGLSTSLRVEAAAHGVHVTAVCPGPVETPILDTPGPVDARALLTAALGEPYPAERLAEDVLAGVAEDRALVVAPGSAREAWSAYRRDPEGVLGAMAARAAARAASRAGGGGEHPQVTGT
ncbi:MAG: SDR family NAD(P)-dependent oxidoreductase, partial [Acidimicrobiales bacterium]